MVRGLPLQPHDFGAHIEIEGNELTVCAGGQLVMASLNTSVALRQLVLIWYRCGTILLVLGSSRITDRTGPMPISLSLGDEVTEAALSLVQALLEPRLKAERDYLGRKAQAAQI